MATWRGDVTKVGEKGPGLVEMLDDIAADDPVEFLFEDGDDLPGVAAIDVVDSLAGHRCRLRIELDSDDATFLSGLQGRAEGSLAAAELEDGLRLGADARQQIFPMLPAERAPAVDVVASRENHRPPGQRAAWGIIDVVEKCAAAKIRRRIGRIPFDEVGISAALLHLGHDLLQLAEGQIRSGR